MPGYLRTADVNAKLDAAVAAHPDTAARGRWAAGHEGRSAGYVKIAATTPASPRPRWAVLITGGIHPRELAPPDALVSFVEQLLAAYAAGTGVSYPAWTSPLDGVVYDAFEVSDTEVRAVVERLDLFVAPLVNADGRDWVLAPLPAGASMDEQELHKNWRKNRRPKPAGVVDELGVGVDINRNFDILFTFEDHYDVAVAGVHTSSDPLQESYCGDKAESEPETANVARLLRSEGIGYFLDVHAYERSIMFPWGIETNQSTDASKAFTNEDWDHKRDGTDHNAYAEYIPAAHDAAAADVARRMSQAVATRAGGSDPVARRRSVYEVKPSSKLYVTSGASDDYAFSRWFTTARRGRPIRPVIALTMESGGNPRRGRDFDDGAFSPGYVTQFPKVEREIHAAVWSFLTTAAATPVAVETVPPGPQVPADKTCFVATAVYRDAGHPSVAFLRDVRDRQLPASGPGRRFAASLTDAYDRAGPPLAGWLARHPVAARLTRGAVLEPAVQALRALSAGTARFPRARSLALSAALGVTAWPVVASLRALRARTA